MAKAKENPAGRWTKSRKSGNWMIRIESAGLVKGTVLDVDVFKHKAQTTETLKAMVFWSNDDISLASRVYEVDGQQLKAALTYD